MLHCVFLHKAFCVSAHRSFRHSEYDRYVRQLVIAALMAVLVTGKKQTSIYSDKFRQNGPSMTRILSFGSVFFVRAIQTASVWKCNRKGHFAAGYNNGWNAGFPRQKSTGITTTLLSGYHSGISYTRSSLGTQSTFCGLRFAVLLHAMRFVWTPCGHQRRFRLVETLVAINPELGWLSRCHAKRGHD